MPSARGSRSFQGNRKLRTYLPHILTGLVVLILPLACKSPVRVVDDSPLALSANQATMVLGGCARPLARGYDSCQLTDGSLLPTLSLLFMNPADYVVSDCEFGLFKTGSIEQPGVVEIDLAPLSLQINKSKLCILKVEAIERWVDESDVSHPIPLAGGFFIEMFPPHYFPVAADTQTAFCLKVSRTTAGRTKVEPCL